MDFVVLPGTNSKITEEFMRITMTGAHLMGIGRSGIDNRELIFAFSDGHAIHLESDANGMIQHKKTSVHVKLTHLSSIGESRF